MRVKPHVNTLGVKTMVTFGQEPTRFTRFELGQTDRTLRRGLRLGFRVVREDGERGEDGGVEAAGHGGGGDGVVVEDELRSAAVTA